MNPITLIVPTNNVRYWHQLIANRLQTAGFEISFMARNSDPRSAFVDMILASEAKLFLRHKPRLSAQVAAPDLVETADPNAHILDLTGRSRPTPETLSLHFSPGNRLCQLAHAIAKGDLPDIAICQNGTPVTTARPMIDDRVITIRGLEDVLARAVTLAVTAIEKRANKQSLPNPMPFEHSDVPDRFLPGYFLRALPRLFKEIWRRRSDHYAHWRTGFRFNSAQDITDTHDLSGGNWHVLPDNNTRFYADPFAFSHAGKHYIFLEDYPHATGKALISVTEIFEDGTTTTPIPVIEESWHLSYPQIFTRNDEIWMLPEASGSNALTLYRATKLPYQWERHSTLIKDCEISDATLLDHEGKLYLFATDRDGAGSTSDTLVVFYADQIEGPWQPHPANPICIDRTRARPGGALIKRGNRLFLPVQDGTLGYGGGLGLVEITKLTPAEINLGDLSPINATGHWPYPRIHTYNRYGNLEVIDGIAKAKKP